jgi:hypothetical protein
MDTPNIDRVLNQFACEGLEGDWHAHHQAALNELKTLRLVPKAKLDRIQERIDNLVALREHAIKFGGSLYEAARCQSDIEVLLWVQRVFACV